MNDVNNQNPMSTDQPAMGSPVANPVPPTMDVPGAAPAYNPAPTVSSPATGVTDTPAVSATETVNVAQTGPVEMPAVGLEPATVADVNVTAPAATDLNANVEPLTTTPPVMTGVSGEVGGQDSNGGMPPMAPPAV